MLIYFFLQIWKWNEMKIVKRITFVKQWVEKKHKGLAMNYSNVRYA